MMASQVLGLSSAFLFALSRPFRRIRRWHGNAAIPARLNQAVMETLQERRMLSVDASIVSNVLIVNGDSGGVTIRVYQLESNNDVYVAETGQSDAGPFHSGDFNSIKINCGTGNDAVIIEDSTHNTPDLHEVAVSKPCEIHGGQGNDTLYGSDQADVITGDAGSDTLYGGLGGDYLDGAYGYGAIPIDPSADELHGDGGIDTLDGGHGDDVLFGGDDLDVMYGGYGIDIMDGDGGDDIMFGGYDDDVISGDDGADLMYGGYGNDVIDGGNGGDILYGDEDADQLDGGDGSDLCYGGAGNDTISGSAGTSTGHDNLDGGDGTDSHNNTSGSDVLINFP